MRTTPANEWREATMADDTAPPRTDEDEPGDSTEQGDDVVTLTTTAPVRWHRAPDLVDVILKRANDPWVSLDLGGEIARVRAGGIVALMGGTGSGKSSLAAGLLAAHAREHGPAVALSIELPADEFAARIIGMRCDASWSDVLLGQVPRHEMERALDLPRLILLDRQRATLDGLSQALRELRRDHPDEPILVAIDYCQIIGGEGDDIRLRVSDIFAHIDSIARAHRAVVLALSQMSRVNSRAVKSGEKFGADTTDAGAESAAIERWATCTLTIGAEGEPAEDGTKAVALSLGKHRMGIGDRVIPMRYCGRTGRWRVDGDARPASEVRAEVKAEQAGTKVTNTATLIRVRAEDSPEPLTRAKLQQGLGVGAEVSRAATELLLKSGELVEVQRCAKNTKIWLLWTPGRAEAAGVPVVVKA